VKLNQRKDFASAPGSEIVTTTSCSSFTTEQDKKQVDEQHCLSVFKFSITDRASKWFISILLNSQTIMILLTVT
jgi:hypothetical protein